MYILGTLTIYVLLAVVVVSIYKGASSPFSLEKHAIGHTSHIMHLIQVVMVGVVSESNFE